MYIRAGKRPIFNTESRVIHIKYIVKPTQFLETNEHSEIYYT